MKWYIIVLYFFVSILFVASCRKKVDVSPKSQTLEDYFIQMEGMYSMTGRVVNSSPGNSWSGEVFRNMHIKYLGYVSGDTVISVSGVHLIDSLFVFRTFDTIKRYIHFVGNNYSRGGVSVNYFYENDSVTLYEYSSTRNGFYQLDLHSQ